MVTAARRGLIAALVVVVAGLIVFFGGRAVWNAVNGKSATVGCTVGNYQLETGQAVTASIMVGVVLQRGLPERAAVLVLAAGLQESKLRNLAPGDGDRDSVGVLQQRPSQGWGTPAQLNDVHYATGKFLDALVKIDGWQDGNLADTIQAIQISADGSLYAQHEGEAQALADTFTGKTPAGIACSFPKPTKVATPQVTAEQVKRDLPINPPRTSEHAVSVPGASWPTAAWFVANADRLGIDRVSYSGQTWERGKKWHTDPAVGAAAVVATLHS